MAVWAARALGGLGSEAKKAEALLKEATRDGQPDVREAAMEALKKIQGS